MAYWDCPECAARNSSDSPACQVCDSRPPAPVKAPVDGPFTVPGPPAEVVDEQAYGETSLTLARDRPFEPPPPSAGMMPVEEAAEPEDGPAWRRWNPALIPMAILLVVAISGAAYEYRGLWLPQATSSTPSPVLVPSLTSVAPLRPRPTIAPARTTTAPTTPSTVGLVTIAPSLDPTQVHAVAVVFDNYFSGINSRDYSRALAMYDPAGVVNPNDAKAVARFKQTLSTTSDTDIRLVEVSADTTGRGVLQSRLTFVSRQSSGFGPTARPGETCTAWDVTYILSQSSGYYLIQGAAAATNSPC